VNAFFDSVEQRDNLVCIARSWLGTPFHPHAAIRGVGVDCVHLLAEIYRESGLFAGYELPLIYHGRRKPRRRKPGHLVA
jgi:hypothetical protein